MERTSEQIASDYKEFHGKCKELCEAEMQRDSSLDLVRGHYFCPAFGEQAHWWLVKPDGSIMDPSARQFPSNGAGFYVPFNGLIACSQCGKEMEEKDAEFESNYAFCSYECHGKFVGVF